MSLVKTMKVGDEITFDFSGSDIKKVTLKLLHGKGSTFSIAADKKIDFDHIKHVPGK